MEKINEKDVLESIQRALCLDTQSITLESSVWNVNEWDSLGHLGILTMLDELFGGKIASIKEMAKADSVKTILKILKNNSLI